MHNSGKKAETETGIIFLKHFTFLILTEKILIVADPDVDTVPSFMKDGKLDLNMDDVMKLATQYLGKEGVEELLNGDYSKLENFGKTLFGGGDSAAEDIIEKVLNYIPEGEFGRKLKEDDTSEDDPVSSDLDNEK